MKELKMIRNLFILIMSIGLILTFTNSVYAVDEDPFMPIIQSNTESSNESSNVVANNTTNSDAGNSLFTNPDNNTNANTNVNEYNTLTTNNVTSNNTTNVVNRSVSNQDTLAKTGLEDSKGLITLIVLVCGISAIYSYKKINDYKKL